MFFLLTLFFGEICTTTKLLKYFNSILSTQEKQDDLALQIHLPKLLNPKRVGVVKLQTKYKDRIGRVYLIKKDIIIELEKVNTLQKIVIVLKNINRFINNIFT